MIHCVPLTPPHYLLQCNDVSVVMYFDEEKTLTETECRIVDTESCQPETVTKTKTIAVTECGQVGSDWSIPVILCSDWSIVIILCFVNHLLSVNYTVFRSIKSDWSIIGILCSDWSIFPRWRRSAASM